MQGGMAAAVSALALALRPGRRRRAQVRPPRRLL